MDNATDLLQKKIDEARANLTAQTRQAIDAVNWRGVIAEMRDKDGYNLEQLGELESETELLLCGLLSGEGYKKELETRMKITKDQVQKLTEKMNEQVFKKIQEELKKILEGKTELIKETP